MWIRASVILLFGAMILAGSPNASARGPSGGAFVGGHVGFQSGPFVDRRFVDRRFFFFAPRPVFFPSPFFVAPPFFVPSPVFFVPPPVIVAPPPFAVTPFTPFVPF